MGVFGYGADAKPKVKVEVEVVAEGDVMTGSIFLNPSERIIDMMNDQRGFVAFEHNTGLFEVISKALISRVRPTNQEAPEKMKQIPRLPGT